MSKHPSGPRRARGSEQTLFPAFATNRKNIGRGLAAVHGAPLNIKGAAVAKQRAPRPVCDIDFDFESLLVLVEPVGTRRLSPGPAHASASCNRSSGFSSSMKASTSCGTGLFQTGANDCRCNGEGPCSRRAAMCFGVLYPLLEASP